MTPFMCYFEGGASLVLLSANHLKSLIWSSDLMTPCEVASHRVHEHVVFPMTPENLKSFQTINTL